MTSIILRLLLLLAIGIACLIYGTLFAHAHDSDHHTDWIGESGMRNPSGEFCCGVSDCAEMADDAVTETTAGYQIDGNAHYFSYPVGEGAVSPPRDVHIKEFVPQAEATPSPTTHYWRCDGPYINHSDGSTERTRRCFLVPPRNF